MRITVSQGQSLKDALFEHKFYIEQPCGGRGTCGGCKVKVEGFGFVKACQFRLPGTYQVTVSDTASFSAIMNEDELKPIACEVPRLAVDLGTTTVVVVGFYQGKMAARSFINPQRAYGADVLSRIEWANKGKGMELSEMLRTILFSYIKEILKELMAPAQKKVELAIAGNTVMLHLLFGYDVSGLGKAPFTPVTLDATELNCKLHDEEADLEYFTKITAFPGFCSFVGADILSGVYYLKKQKADERFLLIDLGTNGEMALCDREHIYVTSTAAGPAFEGNAVARKLYAAGVLRLLAKLRKEKIIDEHGLLQEPYFEHGYPVEEAGAKELFVTQELIHTLMMAKAAIRAGIEVLCKKAGISIEKLLKVYLAGGMGYYIAVEDAIAIGMLPKEFLEKTVSVGNSSLLGAIQYQKSKDRPSELLAMKQLQMQSVEILLAEEKGFEERYISFMDFA